MLSKKGITMKTLNLLTKIYKMHLTSDKIVYLETLHFVAP